MKSWEFWIDVGGTFTDCIARSPDDRLVSCKVLSSGTTKGQVGETLGPVRFSDPGRVGPSPRFWVGYEIRMLDATGEPFYSSRVEGYDHHACVLTTAALLPENLVPGTPYELRSGE